MYSSAFTTSRRSVVRGRPKRAAGNNGSTSCHSRSVRPLFQSSFSPSFCPVAILVSALPLKTFSGVLPFIPRPGAARANCTVLEPTGDFRYFLAAPFDEAQAYSALRRAETIGCPAGSEAWLKSLEAQTGRALMPPRRGPKKGIQQSVTAFRQSHRIRRHCKPTDGRAHLCLAGPKA